MGERAPEWIKRIAVAQAIITPFRSVETTPVPEKCQGSITGGNLEPEQPFVFIHGSWKNRTRVGVLSQIQNSLFQEENAAQQLKRVVEATLQTSPLPGDPRSRAGELTNVLREITGRPAKGKNSSILIGYGVGTPFVCATFNPEAGEAGLLPTGVLDQSLLEKNLFDYWTRVRQRRNAFVAGIEIDELCALLNFVLIKRLDTNSSPLSQSESPFGRVINPYFLSEVFTAQAPLEYMKAAKRDKSPHPVIEFSLSRLKASEEKLPTRQRRT